jgi:hypothetical protein
MTPGEGVDPADADGAGTGPSPNDARAETYLRLRAEAELRRALTLPRYEPQESPGMPGPLRFAAGLTRPAASAVASVAGPVLPLVRLAGDAARRLQPLAGQAARTVQPLADDTARRLRPLADQAARTVRPLADRAARTVLPAAGDAARRVRPLAGQAAWRLQTLRYSAPQALRELRWRAGGTVAGLRSVRHEPAVEEREPSAEEGVDRLATVAHALSYVGVIERDTTDSIIAGLETALAARSRTDPHQLAMRELHARHRTQPARAPAGTYLAVPIGVTVPAAPDRDQSAIHLITLVISPDQATVTLAGRLPPEPPRGSPHHDPWLTFGLEEATATDDRGTSYELHEISSWSDDDGEWNGVLEFSPIPAPGTRWLDLVMSPDAPAIRVELTGAGGQTTTEPSRADAGGPAERMIDAVSERLLCLAPVHAGSRLDWHTLSGLAEIVTALDAVGALDPARAALGRLLTVAGRLGMDVPPVLSAAAQPSSLPEAWEEVLKDSRRRDGPRGMAPAAVVLPELHGTRFIITALHSDETQAELDVMAWGWQDLPPYWLSGFEDNRWSWSARDDKGHWHVMSEGSSSSDDTHANLRLRMVPPPHPDATSLQVTVTGRSDQATATVPLDWRWSG